MGTAARERSLCVQAIANKFTKQSLVSRQIPQAVHKASIWLCCHARLGLVLTKLFTFLEKLSTGFQLMRPANPAFEMD